VGHWEDDVKSSVILVAPEFFDFYDTFVVFFLVGWIRVNWM
jgi:hypothetical protein